MKKLTLQIEELAVESFATGEHGGEKGTVEANAGTRNGNTCPVSCNGSCLPSCGGTCLVSCTCQPTEPYLTCIEPCIPPPID